MAFCPTPPGLAYLRGQFIHRSRRATMQVPCSFFFEGRASEKKTGSRCLRSAFHEKAFLCQAKSFARPSGGSRKGACPRAGGAAVFAARGEPARPGVPLWGNG